MNKISKLLAGVALVAAPVAANAAECVFVSETHLPAETVAKQIAEYQPTTVGEYLTQVFSKADPTILFANMPEGCKTQILKGALQVNNLRSSDPISVLQGRELYIPTKVTITVPPPPRVSTTPTPQETSVLVVQPVLAAQPEPVVSHELAAVRAELATVKKRLARVQTMVANRPQTADESAKITALQREVGRLTAIENRLTKLETSDLAQNGRLGKLESSDKNQNGRLSALETAMKGKANSADVYNKTQIVEAFATQNQRLSTLEGRPIVGGVSNWFWWLCVIGIPLALLIGLLDFLRKDPKVAAPDLSGLATTEDLRKAKLDDTSKAMLMADITGLKADVADIKEQGGFKTVTLQEGWYQKLHNLARDEEARISILFDGEVEYYLNVRQSGLDEVYVIDGLKGHQAMNAVKIGNLARMVTTAANPDPLKFRLTLPSTLQLDDEVI